MIRRETVIEQNVRRLVARELHDRVAQTLTGMLVDLENFKLKRVASEEVLEQLETVQTSTRQVLANLRQVLHDLRGEGQIRDDFVDVLGDLIGRFEERSRIGATLNVEPGWPDSLTPSAFVNLYRIVEEALSNVLMHSGARSVRIVMEPSSIDELVLVIDDDGRGFDADLARPMGLGTVGMKERVGFLGGHLRIESEIGRGTRVQAVFPKSHLIPPPDSARPRHFVAGRVTA